MCAAVAVALLAAAPPARAGEVRGVALLEGARPLPIPLPVTKDARACGEAVEDESIEVADGKLANVVVVLEGASPAPPAKLTLDQKRCRFVPHVIVASRGSTLEIVNSDAVLHNVHGWAGLRTRFNEPMPGEGQRAEVKLDKKGLIQVRCDVHAWMAAYVVVVESPAALTGTGGSFTLRDISPGTYRITAWHERLGDRSAEVTVPEKGTAQVIFTFAGR